MKTGVVAAVTTGALLFAGGSTGSHEQFTPPPHAALHNPYLPAEDKNEIIQAETTVAKWAGLTTKLVILEGEQTYPNAILAYDATDGPEYDNTVDAVIIGAESYNNLLADYADGSPGTKQAVTKFVIAHELGHGWQVKTGIKTSSMEYDKKIELQADCRAGAAAKELFATDIPTIQSQMQRIGGDQHHGSTQQRIDRFMAGAASGEC